MIDVLAEFEAELRRRRLSFHIDAESGRHAISLGGGKMLVSLDNLRKDVGRDGDAGRITRFVDTLVASVDVDREVVDPANLYWCLEPNDHVDKADILQAVSDRVDRVLCHVADEGRLISWMTPELLTKSGLDLEAAAARGFDNLGVALTSAEITFQEVGDVKLGMVGTRLPFKSSLILAPNAREIFSPVIGWPLLAVAPDRDFLLLWDARHADFAGRVGGVTVSEFSKAPYPISTEVYRVDDTGVRAIGEFPRPETT
jgi:hypothetical protein